MSFIEFGEFTPDLPTFLNKGLNDCKNVKPAGASYKPFRKLSIIVQDTLTNYYRGSIAVRNVDGIIYNYIGDETKLYSLTNSTFDDKSQVGGYATAEEEQWKFVQWGAQVVATNYNDPIQVITISGANFADLGGTPPNARYMAVVKNFLVLGNINDTLGDGEVPYRVQWSGFEDITNWGTSAATQADYEDLEEQGGAIKAIIGGEQGIIIREKAIHRMTYVGSPSVFQFDVIETNRGTQIAGSVLQFGNLIAYIGDDGFYVFDGTRSIPIGANKVNDFFYETFDTNYRHRVTTAIDNDDPVLYWSYPAAGNTGGAPNQMLAYNIDPNSTKRWSYINPTDGIEGIFNTLSGGYTLEELDLVSTNVDLLTPTMDSSVWKGGTANLSAINGAGQLVDFSGDVEDARLETPEFEINEGYRTKVLTVRPVVDGVADLTIEIGTRDLLSETVTYTSPIPVSSDGFFNLRSNARYHRFRFNTSGSFNDIQGFQIIATSRTGRR